jgi:GNAT superfamily N-acetyltransferase
MTQDRSDDIANRRLEDLPPSAETSVQLLDMTAGWGPNGFATLKQIRRLGYPAADYIGLCAIEKGEVISMVRVLRIPFSTTKGRETVSAIQGVVTRRDRSRHGLARRLLNQVHRRERAAGSRIALLWTGHSNMAHNLYNSVGYLDLYTPPLAMRRIRGQLSKPNGYELRKIKRGDSGVIEGLHAAATLARLGFTPRATHILDWIFKLGFVKQESLRLILQEGEPVGYLELQKNQGWVQSEELLLRDPSAADDVVTLLESEADGGWLVLRGTSVRDHLGTLRRRRYSFSDYSYFGLLGLSLEGGGPDSLKALGTADSRFTCQLLDYF